jgi:CheY-like chemotaxis protein
VRTRAGFESCNELLRLIEAQAPRARCPGLSYASGAPQRLDIVLTDERMPELMGTDLAREIRLLRPDIPIVLTSGYSGAL